MNFSPADFWKAFIAELVLKGEHEIQPKSLNDRRGFMKLMYLLDAEAARLKEVQVDKRSWYRDVVLLRNHVKPSSSGSFEKVELELRDLQHSSLMLPNPDYEDMTFQVSPPYARSILDTLNAEARELVARAAEAFLDVRYQSRDVQNRETDATAS